MNYDELKQYISVQKMAGKKIVLATGVFDLLHIEHRNFLSKAKHEGDLLIVGIESDMRVKAIKGADRPQETQEVRLQKVLENSAVDVAFILPDNFGDKTEIEKLMDLIRPNVLAVSSHSPFIEKKADMAKKYGGELRIVHEHNPAISTTKIIANQGLAKIKAVLIDVDGTLVKSDKSISPAVIAKIGEAREAGYVIGLCTGRQAPILKYIFGLMGNWGTHVVAGGAQVVKVGKEGEIKVLWEKLISQHDGLDLLQTVTSMGGQAVVGTVNGLFGYQAFLDRIIDHPWKVTAKHIDKWDGTQASLISIHQLNDELAEYLLTQTKLHAVRMRTADGIPYIDVTAHGVSKLEGVEVWAKNNDLKLSEIMGIGDGENDYEYMEKVGWPVAMGNAVEEVKEIAKWQVGSCEQDGVAQALDLLLQNK